jgi:hypothetical protein
VKAWEKSSDFYLSKALNYPLFKSFIFNFSKIMYKKLFIFCFRFLDFLILIACRTSQHTSQSSASFGNRCTGQWTGMMYIWARGQLRDSVRIEHEVSPTQKPNEWTWKTRYLSPVQPMTKDYLLRLENDKEQIYVTDEGQNLLLNGYVFENKMYNIFETQNILLTSSYELLNDRLIFEVTSGKKTGETAGQVSNFSVTHLQRAVLYRKGMPTKKSPVSR